MQGTAKVQYQDIKELVVELYIYFKNRNCEREQEFSHPTFLYNSIDEIAASLRQA